MDLFEAIRGRRSCRRFTPEAVPREALERILEAATWAPSGKNRQNWRIFVVQGEARDRLAEISGRSYVFHEGVMREYYQEKVVEFTRGFFRDFGGARVVLVFYTEKTKDGPFVDLQSGAAAVQNALLACVAEGLQGCWMTGPTAFEPEITALLGAEGLDLVALVPVGHPAKAAPTPPRREGRVTWVGF
ncbi:MAG: nitroreductase family protein [Candidatus Methylomirabilia bacterium]